MRLFFLLLLSTSLYCDNAEKIHKLHKEIGEGLIGIRKSNPHLQAEVYKLLDQVGKLCRFSDVEIQERKKMEQASKDERQMRFALNVENEKLKHTLESLQKDYKHEHIKLVENQRKVNALVKEKTNLVQKNQEFHQKEKEYQDKMRALEGSLTKTSLTGKADIKKPAKTPKNLHGDLGTITT